MLNSLTRSRSPSYYHRLMFKIAITVGLVYFLWEPARPVRNVTADLLSYAAEQIRR
jgi:hypothetical protein